MKGREEENRIRKIVDRVLKQIFGKEATDIIYRYLESHYSLSRNEITDKVDLFAKGLEDFLHSGASAIEHRILEDVYSSLGLLRRIELEKTGETYGFADQIKLLSQRA